MAEPYRFLRLSIRVFRVLAWLALAIQVLTGAILLIGGGEPELVGGVEVPARVLGLLSFVAAGMYFFSLWLMGSLIQLWLDIRAHLSKT